MIIEICAATVLFWRGNPNFRSVIMLDDKLLNDEQIKEKNRISDEIALLVGDLYKDDEGKMAEFLVRSVLYGAAADKTVDTALLKSCLTTILR